MAYEGDEHTRRRYRRHPGPFSAWRIGTDRQELRVKDLNLGGCFVLGDSPRGFVETFQLQVDLGDKGLLDVSAATLYHTPDGAAVTFLNLNPHAFGQIQSAVAGSWPP